MLMCSVKEIEPHFSCGALKDIDSIRKNKYMLIKAHRYSESLASMASLVLFSYRDIRDCLASGFRKFGVTPTIQRADELVDQYEAWSKISTYNMRYEDMLKNKEFVIKNIARAMNINVANTEAIVKQLDGQSFNSSGDKNKIYHETNLYHKGHITDGRHGSWKGQLDHELLRNIVEKHGQWLSSNGYPLELE